MGMRALTVALMLVAGCGGQAKDLSNPASSGSAGQGTGTSETGGSGGSPAVVSAAGSGGTSTGAQWPGGELEPPEQSLDELRCPTQEPRSSQMFASLAEKQQALIGWWLQCSTQGIGPEDAVGLAIAPDGHFNVLVRDEDGAIVPGVGVLHEGQVELDRNAVVFASVGGGEQTSLLFSDETPYRMYAFNTDFIGYDYIR